MRWLATFAGVIGGISATVGGFFTVVFNILTPTAIFGGIVQFSVLHLKIFDSSMRSLNFLMNSKIRSVLAFLFLSWRPLLFVELFLSRSLLLHEWIKFDFGTGVPYIVGE